MLFTSVAMHRAKTPKDKQHVIAIAPTIFFIISARNAKFEQPIEVRKSKCIFIIGNNEYEMHRIVKYGAHSIQLSDSTIWINGFERDARPNINGNTIKEILLI